MCYSRRVRRRSRFGRDCQRGGPEVQLVRAREGGGDKLGTAVESAVAAQAEVGRGIDCSRQLHHVHSLHAPIFRCFWPDECIEFMVLQFEISYRGIDAFCSVPRGVEWTII